MRNKALREAIEKAGGVNALGRKLGISGQAVQKWRRVPAERIVDIERLTGVPRDKLRPDLYKGMAA
jgi:DNA-binding transcriptional regulator YdaS (Cro superfamily)